MEDFSKQRLFKTDAFPGFVYVESVAIFFFANFMFHQNVFRISGSRPQFAAFMLVNAFTSFQLAQAFNPSVIKWYSTIYENTKEMEHRAKLNEMLRSKMFRL